MGGSRIGESQNTWLVGDRDTENKEMIKKRQREKERELDTLFIKTNNKYS